MPATVYNFDIEQSSDFYISFQYIDENGNNIDLTEACVKLRYVANNGAQGVFTNGGTGTDKPSLFNDYGYKLTANSSGTIELTLSTDLTSTLSFATALYDLDVQFTEIGDGSQRVKNTRIATGTITILQKNFLSIGDCDPAQVGSTGPTPTPTPTSSGGTPSPTPTPAPDLDLCLDCAALDIFSVVYSNNDTNIVIPDCVSQNSTPGQVISTISGVYDTRVIENIEVAIIGLNHSSPQDLSVELDTPFGASYTLSSFNKISNYVPNFSYIFSNKAASGTYINSVSNNGYCLPYDDLMGSPITPGFTAPSGDWSLNIYDNDVGGSGYINSWKLIITYAPEE